jgi:hypothetical protein
MELYLTIHYLDDQNRGATHGRGSQPAPQRLGAIDLLFCVQGGCSVMDVLSPVALYGALTAGIDIAIGAFRHRSDTASEVYRGQ